MRRSSFHLCFGLQGKEPYAMHSWFITLKTQLSWLEFHLNGMLAGTQLNFY